MRSLVFLVAVTYCSAQPSAKLITAADGKEDLQSVAVSTPYFNPLGTPYFHPYSHPLATPYTYPLATPYIQPLVTPYTHPLATPYLHSFGHIIKADSTLKATEFPYIWEAAEPEATPAVEEARRRRREVKAVQVPLPYLHAIPAVAKTTVETKQFESVEAATPADTTKLELTTKEHEIAVPAIKYVQPVVNYKPLTYTAFSPTALPFQYGAAALPFHYGAAALPYHYGAAALPYHYGVPALPYTLAHNPIIKLED